MHKSMKIFCVQQKYLPEKKYYPPGNRNYVGRISIYPAGDGEILLKKPLSYSMHGSISLGLPFMMCATSRQPQSQCLFSKQLLQ